MSSSGLQLEYMDRSANPKDDFGTFVNGKWSEENPIPDAYGQWGVFLILRDTVLGNLKSICSEKGANCLESDSNDGKIGRFWKAAMDEDTIEAAGFNPIQKLWDQIDKIESVEEFIKQLGYLHSIGVDGLFDSSVLPDFKDSTLERFFVSQGGLTLPDKEYYLDDSKKEIRQQYLQHVESMFKLAGSDSPSEAAAIVLQLETKIAENSKSKTEMRDMQALYNPQTPQELEAHEWPWNCYFQSINVQINSGPYIINATPSFFDFLVQQVTSETISEWKIYLQWHLVHSMASYLSKAFVDEAFNLSKVLSGAKELEPRWKRVINTLNSHAGELLGFVYCEEKFTAEAKEKCLHLIEHLRKALSETIRGLEWMGDETKEQALEKLKAMGVKIGFPDEWIDYSTLDFDAGKYAENIIAANMFEHERNVKRVNKPVEPHRWEMPPQVVNAYYHPMRNEIVFPAAILQKPAFDIGCDDALNYGAIGAVIGHEMTHGFDDQGRLFNSKGNMIDWWHEDDDKKFKELASTIVDQYAEYQIFGRNVNGELTQGENIADIGGVKIAFRAYQMLLEEQGGGQVLDGFTPEQRFFIAWGQFWASAAREEQALKLLAADPHSPSSIRAYAPLKNVEDFYKAFDVQSTNAMYLEPEKRMAIWG